MTFSSSYCKMKFGVSVNEWNKNENIITTLYLYDEESLLTTFKLWYLWLSISFCILFSGFFAFEKKILSNIYIEFNWNQESGSL